ncbi:unnamed protein product [Gulo gulo]|uniref:Uncharacterized protein n=1 Tax=Gulo gulo TaxID=48420 RepID=A0A9X9LF30_GULGU|nr:unnamed protein product [Gulo gulo]
MRPRGEVTWDPSGKCTLIPLPAVGATGSTTDLSNGFLFFAGYPHEPRFLQSLLHPSALQRTEKHYNRSRRTWEVLLLFSYCIRILKTEIKPYKIFGVTQVSFFFFFF